MPAIDQVMSAFVRGVRARYMHARIHSGQVTETAAEQVAAVSDHFILLRARTAWWARLAADEVTRPRAAPIAAAAEYRRPAADQRPAPGTHPAESRPQVEPHRVGPPHRIAEYRIPLRAG
ncbi:hypothetical protein JK358_07645 [Nocardia sp. 2]|uniref:Uncharacterized protein n=1 Tax=Nocardia acididurans TaxID=2802282 RepID=A0ABS1M0R4_9NOCA|nr:hypothetical protein [Nocardia acididurans]MBL1074268.1 hypothetical protein [Nocardia acididurans]